MKETSIEKIASALETAADSIAERDSTISNLQKQVETLSLEKDELAKTAGEFENLAFNSYDEMGAVSDEISFESKTGTDMLDDFLGD